MCELNLAIFSSKSLVEVFDFDVFACVAFMAVIDFNAGDLVVIEYREESTPLEYFKCWLFSSAISFSSEAFWTNIDDDNGSDDDNIDDDNGSDDDDIDDDNGSDTSE